MDPLTQALMQRALAQQPPSPQVPPTPNPVIGSMGKTNTPPEAQRFATAQKMMDAIRNQWTPNPILTQVTVK